MGQLIKRMIPGDSARCELNGLYTILSLQGIDDDLPPKVVIRSSLDDRSVEIPEGESFRTHLKGEPIEVKFARLDRQTRKASLVFKADNKVLFELRRGKGGGRV